MKYIYNILHTSPQSYRARDLRIGQTLPLYPCYCPYWRPMGEVHFEYLVDNFVQTNSEFTNIMKKLDAAISTLKM